MLGHASAHGQVAAGERARDQERSRFDAIRNDGVFGAAQLRDALDANRGRARALDLRAHRDQERGEIGHFRLAGRVLDHGFAAGQHGRHQQVFGAGDRDAVELNMRALKTVGSFASI